MTVQRNDLIGDRVRFYRTSRKISLTKMVEGLPVEITPQQFAKYERGISRWPADLLCEVAILLQTDIRLLLAMENGAHERKDVAEFMAEKYKSAMLSMNDKARSIVYRIIDEIIKPDGSTS